MDSQLSSHVFTASSSPSARGDIVSGTPDATFLQKMTGRGWKVRMVSRLPSITKSRWKTVKRKIKTYVQGKYAISDVNAKNIIIETESLSSTDDTPPLSWASFQASVNPEMVASRRSKSVLVSAEILIIHPGDEMSVCLCRGNSPAINLLCSAVEREMDCTIKDIVFSPIVLQNAARLLSGLIGDRQEGRRRFELSLKPPKEIPSLHTCSIAVPIDAAVSIVDQYLEKNGQSGVEPVLIHAVSSALQRALGIDFARMRPIQIAFPSVSFSMGNRVKFFSTHQMMFILGTLPSIFRFK
eukprot:TRINITY_DN56986_c0_g1_i2.p1 TRINITY_DN56986_c0_g1~~TRINITY_DN56986_c0_g1_i2.p1  ORF type:complete len:297 (+),score=74.39 TRINITY_DN56986_c0_g1_i2:89-979(+)